MESLALLLQSKQANPGNAQDIVREAAQWLEKELAEAKVVYDYTEYELDFSGYAHLQIHAAHGEQHITLHLKIAEVKDTPYVFADIRVRDAHERVFFPFFGEIGSDEGKEIVLNYVADFLLSMPK